MKKGKHQLYIQSRERFAQLDVILLISDPVAIPSDSTMDLFNIDLPKAVEEAMALAGSNRKELEQMIRHYYYNNDSLKLKAAYFLIETMPGNYTQTSKWLDPKGKEIQFKMSELSEDAKLFADLQKKGYSQVLSQKMKDIETITADYLIKNIDLAFYAWKNLPYGKKATFEEFCEYILPYRVGTEKLENWRTQVLDTFSTKIDSIYTAINSMTGFEPEDFICSLHNFKFYDFRAQILPNYLPYSELIFYKLGVCQHTAALVIFTLRGLGIPTAHDKIPLYGNWNYSHSFVTVIDGKKNIPFFDFSFGSLQLGAPARIFRKTYSIQKNSFGEINKLEKNLIPPLLRDNKAIDVTSRFCITTNISLQFNKIFEDEKYAFLCVFNSGRWYSIHWGENNVTGKIDFKDVPKYIVFLPAYFKDGKVVPAHAPITIPDSGSVKMKSFVIYLLWLRM